MTNLIYQGKINRQFWGKLIRHFSKTSGLQCVTWGGCLIYQNGILGNKITFFHYDIRAG